MRKRTLFAVILALAVPSLAVAEGGRATEAEALAIFETVCLERLPGFDRAEAAFVAAGLVVTGGGFWADDRRGLIGRVTRETGQRGCFVALDGADVPGLNAVLGTALGSAMDETQVGVMRGPLPGDPSLYMVDRGSYRVSAVVANVSRGYAMLSVSVDVAEGAAPPWGTP